MVKAIWSVDLGPWLNTTGSPGLGAGMLSSSTVVAVEEAVLAEAAPALPEGSDGIPSFAGASSPELSVGKLGTPAATLRPVSVHALSSDATPNPSRPRNLRL